MVISFVSATEYNQLKKLLEKVNPAMPPTFYGGINVTKLLMIKSEIGFYFINLLFIIQGMSRGIIE